MSAEERLAALRATRDQARSQLTRHAASMKAGLAPKALRQRVRRDVEHRAQAVAREALKVATDSRGIVIGTVALLAVWLGRKPLLGALRNWRDRRRADDQAIGGSDAA